MVLTLPLAAQRSCRAKLRADGIKVAACNPAATSRDSQSSLAGGCASGIAFPVSEGLVNDAGDSVSRDKPSSRAMAR